MGTQPQIDTLRAAQIGGLSDQSHRFGHHPIEKLLVGAGLGALHSPLGGVDDDQVDIAGIIQFRPAELSQRQHR